MKMTKCSVYQLYYGLSHLTADLASPMCFIYFRRTHLDSVQLSVKHFVSDIFLPNSIVFSIFFGEFDYVADILSGVNVFWVILF